MPLVHPPAFTIRPMTDADLTRVAELESLNRAEPLSAEMVRKIRMDFPAEGTRVELMLEDAAGRVRGYGRATRYPHEPPERLNVHVAVDPPARRRGFGAALFARLEEIGATDLRVQVRDDDPESRRFAEACGFAVKEHLFESVLDLERFDAAPFEDDVRRVEAAGVRLFAYGETAMDEAARRRLWSVNIETSLDQPGADSAMPSFEEWTKRVAGASWFDPAGQIVAAVGDEWVGLGAVGPLDPGRFYNLMTGVRAPYRGRGIAKALKILGIRYAQARGGRTLRTNNHSANGPMLAINRRLGYAPEPGWLSMRREAVPRL